MTIQWRNDNLINDAGKIKGPYIKKKKKKESRHMPNIFNANWPSCKV